MGLVLLQELRDIGVQTVWGEPSDIGAALGNNIQAPFDVVLDNNGKTLDVVQYVSHVLLFSFYEAFYENCLSHKADCRARFSIFSH